MNSLLVAIAKFSETMLWVVGFLLAVNLSAMVILVLRHGVVDEEEGTVLNERGRLTGNGLNAPGIHVPIVGAYVVKEKILLSRSEFISDKSLVDGTATKSERLLVYCIKLFFFLLWLLFVFIGLNLLPSQPASAAFFVSVPSIFFFKAALMMHKGRLDALRKLGKRAVAK